MRESIAARVLRRAVLAVLLFGSTGTLAELLLIGHFDDASQFVPLVVLTLVVVSIAAYFVRPGEAGRRIVAAVMWICLAAGPTGVWLHYRGNSGFEREMVPGRAGFELFRESMTGATPVLAPGTLIVIGLFGLIAAWRPRRRPGSG